MGENVRPTKKQRELLGFIEDFIAQHGYSPSYREIMTGLNYTSVATVALHVNNLIKRGHLLKREGKARSLEVSNHSSSASAPAGERPEVKPSEEKWLVEKIERMFQDVEETVDVAQAHLDQLYVMVGALRVLGLEGAAQSFIPRLGEVRKRVAEAVEVS